MLTTRPRGWSSLKPYLLLFACIRLDPPDGLFQWDLNFVCYCSPTPLHCHQCVQYGSLSSILTQCMNSSPIAEKAPPKVDNHDIAFSSSLLSITSLSSRSFLEEYTGNVGTIRDILWHAHNEQILCVQNIWSKVSVIMPSSFTILQTYN
jgi:hypothetical protein